MYYFLYLSYVKFLNEINLKFTYRNYVFFGCSLCQFAFQYVVIPPRRSTAEAFQILISHMFGDAGSPYLVGVISESLKSYLMPSPDDLPSKTVEFRALQYALFITCFVEVLGGIFFLITSAYIVRDKLKVDRAIAEAEAQHTEPSHASADEDIVAGE